MAEKQKFRVLRRMDGDRLYEEGDEREMTAAEAKHLVDLGALEPIEAKAEPAPQNKSEPAPANKAAPRAARGKAT
jgi:hypothetical protein